jgi:hypothetical protein
VVVQGIAAKAVVVVAKLVVLEIVEGVVLVVAASPQQSLKQLLDFVSTQYREAC